MVGDELSSCYLCTEVEFESQETTEQDADQVVATDVQVRHDGLPSASYSHAGEDRMDAVEDKSDGQVW